MGCRFLPLLANGLSACQGEQALCLHLDPFLILPEAQLGKEAGELGHLPRSGEPGSAWAGPAGSALSSGVPSGLVQVPGPPMLQAQPLWGPFPSSAPGPLRTPTHLRRQASDGFSLAGVRCRPLFSASSAFENSLEGSGEKQGGPGDTPAPAPGPPAARAYSSRGSRGVGRTEGAVGRASQSVHRGSGFSLCSF